jgi:hypothetical protein
MTTRRAHPLRTGPRPEDLTAVFRDQLDQVLAVSGADIDSDVGPRGWLLSSGVTDVVGPYVTHLPLDDGDLARFCGLGAPAAQALLERLTPTQLSDRQNDAPTLGTLLRAAVAHPGQVELHGYLVGPVRGDERITAEGVWLYVAPDLDISPRHDPGCQCDELWTIAQRDFGLDDAHCSPHELTRRINPTRPTEPCWSLWWD